MVELLQKSAFVIGKTSLGYPASRFQTRTLKLRLKAEARARSGLAGKIRLYWAWNVGFHTGVVFLGWVFPVWLLLLLSFKVVLSGVLLLLRLQGTTNSLYRTMPAIISQQHQQQPKCLNTINPIFRDFTTSNDPESLF